MAFPPSFLDELMARNPIEDVVGQYVSLKRSMHSVRLTLTRFPLRAGTSISNSLSEINS